MTDAATDNERPLVAHLLELRSRLLRGAAGLLLVLACLRDGRSVVAVVLTIPLALADQQAGKRQPRAVLPGIQLKSPKITRNLTTAWFAKRVDDREQACVRKMATIR